MYKGLRVVLPVVMASFLMGCSDDAETILIDILDKDSVALSDLGLHDVTYENAAGGATHTDTYCLNGMLGDKTGMDGTWSIVGTDLTVTPISVTAYTYQIGSDTLEKNKSYGTTTSETFKVTKIAESLSCL